MSKNGWTNHLVTGASVDDYVTLDEDDALMPRDIKGGMPRRFGRLTADPENPLINAGNASLDDVNGVWAKLVADFPFLQRTVTGTARDLGPYERPGDATGITPVASGFATDKGIRKYISNGRLVIIKNGQRYNAMGQEL